MDNHYTYLLEYSDGGLYHGVRSCHGVIDEDDYYGSSKYTPNEVPIKTILTTHNTREEAIEEEIRYHAEFNVKNNNQYTLRVGVFKKEEGYKQGHIETNEKLLGFITMIRDGDYLQYSWIIGHGDYLNDGIMIFLHLNILEKIVFNKECSYGQGIKYIFYAGHYSGNDTLIKWKEKLFFSPTMLINNK